MAKTDSTQQQTSPKTADPVKCPRHPSHLNVKCYRVTETRLGDIKHYKCNDCGAVWKVDK